MASKCIFKNLKVGCWKIQGLHEKVNGVKLCKLNETFFENTLKTFDILCLQETHLAQDDNVHRFNGYVTIPRRWKKSCNNMYFGGILIYI